MSRLQDIYAQRWERLVDLNEALLELPRGGFSIRPPLVHRPQLAVRRAKSELVLNLCRAVGAHTLLVGLGGSRDYLDRAAFAEAGIGLAFQEFNHPVYPQRGTAPFSAGLSAIDLLFNCGPDSRRVLLGQTTHRELSIV